MDINELRRRKARELARGLTGGLRKGHPEMAERMGWDSSLTSQLIGDNARRKITDRRAREIESKFGKPHGWMDQQEVEPVRSEGEVDEKLLLDCLRAIRKEIARLQLQLDPEDADELLARATMLLYTFSKEAGELLPAHTALGAARL